MKKTLALLAATSAGFLLLTGFHGGGCGAHPHGRDPAQVNAFVTERLDEALDDLDVTQAQRDQLHALKDRILAEATTLHQGQQAARAEMLAQWKSDKPDAATLHRLADQRIEAFRAVVHDAVDAGIQAHGILTPEQRAKVTAKVEKRMGR